MNIHKVNTTFNELADCESLLVIAMESKSDAEERMMADDPFPSNADWMIAASEYAYAVFEIQRLNARIRVLRGRIHFEAQTA